MISAMDNRCRTSRHNQAAIRGACERRDSLRGDPGRKNHRNGASTTLNTWGNTPEDGKARAFGGHNTPGYARRFYTGFSHVEPGGLPALYLPAKWG